MEGNGIKQPHPGKSRIFRIIFCVFILLIAGNNFIRAQKTKENLQKTKKQLEQEIKYTNMLLEQTQKSRQTSLNKLTFINRQIEKRESLIDAINSEIDQIEESLKPIVEGMEKGSSPNSA